MKHDNPETMYSREWLEHERRKAWQEGYAAGWKDQECDFPAIYKRKPISRGHQMEKILEEMILKWHEDGITLEETARLVPQVPKAEITALIHQHDKETRL